jgi:hypothetical protein
MGVTGALVSSARSSPTTSSSRVDILRFTGVDGALASRGFRDRNTPNIFSSLARLTRLTRARALARDDVCG